MYKTFVKLMLAVAVLAVTQQARALNVGVDAGVGFLNDTAPGTTSATRFAGGAFLDTSWNDLLSFRPEVLYSAGRVGGAGGVGGVDALSIPLLIASHFQVGPVVPYVFIGPEFIFRVGSAQPNVNLKTFDLAIDGGVGVDFWLTSAVGIGANWRYAFGLLDVNGGSTVPGAIHGRNMYLLGTVTLKI